MNGIQNALSHLKDDVDLAAMESRIETTISELTSEKGELLLIQRDASRIFDLAATCESLEEGGAFNRPAAIVLMSSLEAMGHEFDLAGLESLTDEQFANTALEGLGSIIAKVGNRLKEWWAKRRYKIESETNNLRALSNYAIKEIAAVRDKLEELDNSARVSISVNGLARALRVGNSSQVDPAKAVTWLDKVIPSGNLCMAAADKLSAAGKDLYNGANLQDDANYEKTVLKKLPAMMNLWLKKPPYDEAGEGLTIKINEPDAQAREMIVTGQGAKVRGYPGGMVRTMGPKLPDKSAQINVSKTDALRWLDSAEKFFEAIIRGNYILTCNRGFEGMYDTQSELYMIEAGKARDSKKIANMEKYPMAIGTLQSLTAPAWSYYEEGLFYSWWTASRTARALITAARRVAVEGK